MHVRKHRNEILKEKKKLDIENQNLAMKMSNIQQLLAILPSQVDALSKAPSFKRQNSFLLCLCHLCDNKGEIFLEIS